MVEKGQEGWLAGKAGGNKPNKNKKFSFLWVKIMWKFVWKMCLLLRFGLMLIIVKLVANTSYGGRRKGTGNYLIFGDFIHTFSHSFDLICMFSHNLCYPIWFESKFKFQETVLLQVEKYETTQHCALDLTRRGRWMEFEFVDCCFIFSCIFETVFQLRLEWLDS